jgi:hypothetical protein
MPSKKHLPQRGVNRPGYSPLVPLFTDNQISQLADILGRSRDVIEAPLNEAALAIGPFLTKPEATELEQAAALVELAEFAQSLLSNLRDLDSRSKQRLLHEYEVRQESLSAAAIGNINALSQFKKDLTAIARVHENLAVALGRTRTRSAGLGRPRNSLERLAVRTLIKAYEQITGGEFTSSVTKGKGVARRFVMTALKMLGIEQTAAAGGILYVLSEKRARAAGKPEKKLPLRAG